MIISSSTNIQYIEHESSNAYKYYPLAETCSMLDADNAPFATDIIVDAILYPIIHSEFITAPITLKQIDFANNIITVGYEQDQELKGFEQNGIVELYDYLNRHAGTLICGPGWAREVVSGRTRIFENFEFSSFTTCPVAHAGVYNISDEDRTIMTTRRNIVFKGDGCINPVVRESNKGYHVRFDVQYNKPLEDSLNPVRQLVFAVAGKSLFYVTQQSDTSVLISTPTIDREDICWQAHKDEIATVVDTCEEPGDSTVCLPVNIPYISNEIEICASDTGNISIIADDLPNYKNAVLVSTVEGEVRPITPKVDNNMTQDDIIKYGSNLLKRPSQIGNGIKISMAGLANGR